MISQGKLWGNLQQVGELMCHLLQMEAGRLLTQAQAQISTLKLAGHLVAAAVCSNALQDAETDGIAENTDVVFIVWWEASLPPSSNIFTEHLGDKIGFPFCFPFYCFCSQLLWDFPPFRIGSWSFLLLLFCFWLFFVTASFYYIVCMTYTSHGSNKHKNMVPRACWHSWGRKVYILAFTSKLSNEKF